MPHRVLLTVCTYPRKNNKTPEVFARMCESLFQKVPETLDLEMLLIGDDYPNIEDDLAPILEPIGIKYTFANINENNALRNMDANKTLKWQHACTRSLIHGFKTALEGNFSHVITFSDDDYYDHDYLSVMSEAISSIPSVDLVFGFGSWKDEWIMPRFYSNEWSANSPNECDTIATGIMFRSRNVMFIEDIIHKLESAWDAVMANLGEEHKPNDAIMWDHLKPKFSSGKYASFLIPRVIVHHDTEQTIYDNI